MGRTKHNVEEMFSQVNISKEQLRFVEYFCNNLPVHFLDSDYRHIRGTFDVWQIVLTKCGRTQPECRY